MYIWNARKHAWNDSVVANVQGAVADQGSFTLLFRSTQSTHTSQLQWKEFIVPTSCSTNTPPPPIPLIIPMNSSKLAQLHNGPLRSCKKIGGKTAVQQSWSKRARRNPSPKMNKLTVHEETRGQWKKRPNPEQPTHNQDSAANRQHPAHLHWCGADPPSSIANPCCWPQRPCPEVTFLPFSRRLLYSQSKDTSIFLGVQAGRHAGVQHSIHRDGVTTFNSSRYHQWFTFWVSVILIRMTHFIRYLKTCNEDEFGWK